jgi:hypothetical protein
MIHFLLFSSLITPSDLKYNYEYKFKGQSKGKFLLIVRYRFYFEAFASIILEAKRINQNDCIFNYNGLNKTGYLARTSGFSGRSLFLLTADEDLIRGDETLKNKIIYFKEKVPYYSKYIRKVKTSRYEVTSKGEEAISFVRSNLGIHENFLFDLKKVNRDEQKKINIYFNVFKILMETLSVYNHSFLPGGINDGKEIEMPQEWTSSELDFTSSLNKIIRLAARVTEKHIRMKQKKTFKLKFKVEASNDQFIQIKGVANPGARIWSGMKILSFTRDIKIRTADHVLLEDKIFVEIKNKKGNGGEAVLSLKLME